MIVKAKWSQGCSCSQPELNVSDCNYFKFRLHFRGGYLRAGYSCVTCDLVGSLTWSSSWNRQCWKSIVRTNSCSSTSSTKDLTDSSHEKCCWPLAFFPPRQLTQLWSPTHSSEKIGRKHKNMFWRDYDAWHILRCTAKHLLKGKLSYVAPPA